MRRTRGKRTDPDVREAILGLHADGWAAPRIQAVLDLDERYAGRVPAERTIRDITRGKDLAALEPWRPMEGDWQDAGLVLEVLLSLRGVPWVHAGVARYIARIRRLVPMLEPSSVLILSARYWHAERTGMDTGPLDAELRDLAAGARQ